MKKAKMQRLLALFLCLIFTLGCFSVTTMAVDGAAASGGNGDKTGGDSDNSSIYDMDEMLALIDAISYDEYSSNNKTVKGAKDEISIDVINDIVSDKSDADYFIGEAKDYGGREAIVTPGTGSVTWKVTIPEKAKYIIKIKYYAVDDGKANSVERVLYVNNRIPFAEARYLTIKKNWVSDYEDAIYSGKVSAETVKAEAEAAGLECFFDEGVLKVKYPDVWTARITDVCVKYDLRFFKTDIVDENELRPSASQTPTWGEYTLADSMGYYTEAFEFVFTAGENTITLEGKNAALAISEIVLCPVEDLDTYDEYLAKHEGLPSGGSSVKLEAEYIYAASDKTVYPIEDSADALTSPHDPSRTVLNTIGGEKWQTAGQWVTYKFTVDKSGMYDIVTRFRQNILDGMYVNRSLFLYSEEGKLQEGDLGYYNGAPFIEAKTLMYNYSDDWQVTQATDGKREFEFYFEKDVVYTLKLEVTLGSMGSLINTVQDSLNSINDDYLAIIQLTGATPDAYRDYGFSRIMPDTLIDMRDQALVLNNDSTSKPGIAQQLTALAGQKSSSVGTLQKISDLLLKMYEDETEIAASLERLKSYIGTLGTFLSDAKTQPLQVDYILIQAADSELPRAKASWWASFTHEVSRFFWSFFRDYDNMGVTVETDGSGLEVWLATGRDQAQVKRNLVNNEFTLVTNIPVELKLVAGGTLLPSILAKQGPDVYHGLGQGDVINYAIRGAILSIEDFEDFEEVTQSFNESAMIVLGMQDAEGTMHYYGLPEAQGFAMMFVRVDILAELGIEIPRTWDDIMAAIPKLQSRNMEIGLTTDTNIHLYQMGGTLFADNGMRINLDSQVGLAAFKKMCELFTKYSFPYTYDAANRFRTGEMPILIGDYTGLYNQLKVFATEIEGLWSMVPVPGVMREDGTVNNCAVSSVSASVMVTGAEDVRDEAWTYIKWFTGDECQAAYANEMVAIMGPSAKYNTANKEALANLPWTTDEFRRIEAQFNNLASIPNYPGSYIIDRYTNFAFLSAYNDGEDPTQALLGYIHTINKEISRKRAEFGLETLGEGEATLAARRANQANAAADELKSRSASNEELAARILKATKSEDEVTLNTLADEIMTLTSESYAETVKIPADPDIGDLTNEELLYYVARALYDMAAALATY